MSTLLSGFYDFFGKKSPDKIETLTEDANVTAPIAVKDKRLKDDNGIADDPVPATKTKRAYGDWKVRSALNEQSSAEHVGGPVGKTPMDPIKPPAPGTTPQTQKTPQAVPAAPKEEGKEKPAITVGKATVGSNDRQEAAKLIKEAFGFVAAVPTPRLDETADAVTEPRVIIEVCTDPYFARHGKNPSGTGEWKFSVGETLSESDDVLSVSGDYRLAVVKAKAWAKANELAEVFVQA